MFDDPQVRALGMTVRVAHPALGVLEQVRSPISMSRSAQSVGHAAPDLGQDTRAILEELGLGRSEIDRLAERKAIYCAET